MKIQVDHLACTSTLFLFYKYTTQLCFTPIYLHLRRKYEQKPVLCKYCVLTLWLVAVRAWVWCVFKWWIYCSFLRALDHECLRTQWFQWSTTKQPKMWNLDIKVDKWSLRTRCFLFDMKLFGTFLWKVFNFYHLKSYVNCFHVFLMTNI